MPLPDPKFPNGVDDPIVQDANFKIDKAYVKYVDGRVREIETAVLAQGSAGTADQISATVTLPDGPYTLSNTEWSAGTLILKGTLTGTRTVTAPTSITTAPRKIIINETAQAVVFAPSAGGTSVTIDAGATAWIAFDGTNFSRTTSTGADAASIQHVPVDATAPTTTGQVLPYSSVTGKYGPPRKLTLDEVTAAFAPTISASSGFTSPVEIGTTITPVVNPTSPAANAAGVTYYHLVDNQGNDVSRLGTSGTLAAPSGGTYTLSSPGTVSIHAAVTKDGVGPVNSNTLPVAVDARVFAGFGSNTTITGITQSGGNATITGPNATIAGQLAAALVGQTTLFGSMTPSNNFLLLAWHSSFGGTHDIFDNLTGFKIDMQAAVLFSTTTQTGQTCSYYVARSTNNLGTSAIEPYFKN